MNSFHAKILLFGEYTIIKGGMGLAFPLDLFNGQLNFTENQNNLPHKLRLDEFYTYLKDSALLNKTMNLPKLKHDIQNGLYFKSNIPHGYGIGSSGALCAALFAEYAYDFERKNFYSQDELSFLKDILSLMESFYHGTSSGIDCLISLINLPLLIESRSSVKITQLPEVTRGSFYLLDSGHSRTTSAFVHDFLERYENDSDYKKQIKNLVELTNNVINKFQHEICIKEDLHQLSRMQYLNMAKMIPNDIKNFWLEGLETQEYFVKLCGAGGGGYFITYTENEKYQKEFSRDKKFQRILNG